MCIAIAIDSFIQYMIDALKVISVLHCIKFLYSTNTSEEEVHLCVGAAFILIKFLSVSLKIMSSFGYVKELFCSGSVFYL